MRRVSAEARWAKGGLEKVRTPLPSLRQLTPTRRSTGPSAGVRIYHDELTRLAARTLRISLRSATGCQSLLMIFEGPGNAETMEGSAVGRLGCHLRPILFGVYQFPFSPLRFRIIRHDRLLVSRVRQEHWRGRCPLRGGRHHPQPCNPVSTRRYAEPHLSSDLPTKHRHGFLVPLPVDRETRGPWHMGGFPIHG